MSTLTRIEAHARTARMDIHEIVHELNKALGPTLVAALSGIKDREQPIRWAQPDGPIPGHESSKQLILAHSEWHRIVAEEGRSRGSRILHRWQPNPGRRHSDYGSSGRSRR